MAGNDDKKTPEEIKEVCRSYIREEILSAEAFGDGHINDTFLVRTKDRSYVCQCLRSAMDLQILEDNYALYARACEGSGWLFPVWLKTMQGGYFYTDRHGENWRMYPFLQGDLKMAPLTGEELLACGRGLARMHEILQNMPGKPKAVYPHLHDLRYYHEEYLKVLDGKELIGEQRDPDMEKEIRAGWKDYLEVDLVGSGIVHGDAKLANILFRDGSVAGFLDLDTIMQGSLLEDIADCIRSCCIVSGRADKEAAGFLIEGYRQAHPALIGEAEILLLPKVFGKICFELALRYYTDAISEKKVFREMYQGYRLEKARLYLRASREEI